MSQDIATLGIVIDSSQVKPSIDSLDKLASAGKKAEAAVDGLTKATQDAGKAAAGTAAATRQITAEIDRQAAASAAASRSQASQATSIAAAASAAAKGATAYNSLAAGQKLSAYQTQQLSFQLNDLFVQIASGQSPLTALIQQGSQLNGTFGGIGGTLRAVSSIFTVARVAIGGIVGVLASVGLAAAEGARQSSELQKSLILTGNAAGVTEGQFNSLSRTISDSTNTTIGSTRETLQALVSSGKFSGDALAAAAAAAQSLSKVTGQSTDEIVQSFIKAGGSASKFAEEQNNSLHFLTAAQLDYIKTLEDQGRQQEALAITFNALNSRVSEAVTKTTGLAKAWNFVKVEASSAIDAILSLNRAATPQDAVGNIQAQLKALDERRSLNPTATGARRQALTEQLSAAQALTQEVEKAAAASAKSVQTEQAKTAFLKLQEQVLSRSELRAKEIAKANALADRAGVSQADRNKVIANINEKFKDPAGAKGTDTTRVDARAQALLDIEDIKARNATLIDAYGNSEKILEAKRAAVLVSESDYYKEKRQLVEANNQVQIAALEQENARLDQEKLNTKDSLDRDRQVLKNKTEIAKLQAGLMTNLTVLTIQQEAANKRLAASYASAQQAAQSYLDTLTRQNDREIAGLGKGTLNREKDSRRNQRDDQFQQRRDQLDSQRRANQITPEDYDVFLKIEEDAHTKALAADDVYWKQKLDKQKDWTIGAREALQNYADDAANIAKHMEDAVGNAFKGLEDQLTNLFTGKKFDAKKLFADLQADLTRNFVKENITGPLAKFAGDALGGDAGSALGGLFGGDSKSKDVPGSAKGTTNALDRLTAAANRAAGALGGTGGVGGGGGASAGSGGGGGLFGSLLGAVASAFIPEAGYSNTTATALANITPGDSLDNLFKYTKNFAGRAAGGPVSAGEMYRVNEKGPELLTVGSSQYLMMGNSPGSVTPNGAGASRGDTHVTIQQNFAAGTSRATADQAALQASRAITRAQRNA